MGWLSFLNPIAGLGKTYLEGKNNVAKAKSAAAIIGIEADADRQRVVLEAEAYRDSETIRGEGDALAASIYATAFNKDPEFYGFTRSLNAYTQTFNDIGDVLVISPDSEFFKYLTSSFPTEE